VSGTAPRSDVGVDRGWGALRKVSIGCVAVGWLTWVTMLLVGGLPLVSQGVLGGVITCAMCVSDFGHKATCFAELVFLCFDNLMLEFFFKLVGGAMS
jgi:hypothetical protein